MKENLTQQETLKQKIHSLVLENDGYVFKDENFSLRPFNQSDLGFIKEMYSDPLSNAMVAPVTENNPKGLQHKLNSFINSYNENGISCYVLSDKSGKSIGLLGFTYLDDAKTKIEANAMLLPRYQHKTVLSRVSPKIMDLAFDTLGIKELYGEALTYNLASQKAMRAMGMTPALLDSKPSWMKQDGYYKDTNIVRFKITDTEWKEFKSNGMKAGFVEKLSSTPHPHSRTFATFIHSPEEQLLRKSGDKDAKKRLSVYNGLVAKGIDPNFGKEASTARLHQR